MDSIHILITLIDIWVELYRLNDVVKDVVLLVDKSYDILIWHGNIMGFRSTWLKKIIRFSEGTHVSHGNAMFFCPKSVDCPVM